MNANMIKLSEVVEASKTLVKEERFKTLAEAETLCYAIASSSTSKLGHAAAIQCASAIRALRALEQPSRDGEIMDNARAYYTKDQNG